MAFLLALLSSGCFGAALVASRVGLRSLDARSGAAISIPTATILFVIAAPFVLDPSGFTLRAALWFGAVGLFFPVVVTLLTFRSNEQLGPTVTGAVSGTAPLFALLAAAWWLGERIPANAAVACAGVIAGIAILSWDRRRVRREFEARSLLWPLAGALVRGLAQVGAKAGLLLWPNPFAAALIGYLVSSAAVVGVDRIGRTGRPTWSRRGVAWFALTGALNGFAVLAMYAALGRAPVTFVAPVVATYPLATALASAMLIRDEPLRAHVVIGAAITVAAIAYLVS